MKRPAAVTMITCDFALVLEKSLVIIMLSSLLLWALAISRFFPVSVADNFKASDSYINYTTVAGYFLQDEPSTNASTFKFMTTNFGLLNRTYPADSTLSSHHNLTQWQRFKHQVTQLNREAPHGTEYKLLYMGRHGDGYHNDAQAYYGTPAWNCYYSELDGNSTVIWSDAHLSPLGVTQALAVNRFWASEIQDQKIPTPQTFYTSPLTRCLQTANYTFNGLDLPARHPFVPEVKEYFREGISGHTCDRRGSETYIHNLFPNYRIEPGFTRNDELWVAFHGETNTDQDVRSKWVLDSLFSTDRSTYVSITSHSGEIASLLRGKIACLLLQNFPPPSPPPSSFPTNPLSIFIIAVLKHQAFGLSTGATIPVLVKAQTIRGTAPTTTALEPYTAICTCTSPPAVTATTSVCAYPPAETTPGI